MAKNIPQLTLQNSRDKFLLNKEAREYFQLTGRIGGLKTFSRYGEEHYKKISKIGLTKRWKKQEKNAVVVE
jgi:hypothetical protein